MGLRWSQPQAESHRAHSFAETTRARDERVFLSSELQLRALFRCKQLRFNFCDWRRPLHENQRIEERKDWVSGLSVSGVGMVEEDHHTSFICALCELIGRTWVVARRMQSQSRRSSKVCSARETQVSAMERKMKRRSGKSGSLFSFMSLQGALEGRLWRGRAAGQGSNSQDGNRERDGPAKAGCSELKVCTSFATKVETSADCDCPGGIGAQKLTAVRKL